MLIRQRTTTIETNNESYGFYGEMMSDPRVPTLEVWDITVEEICKYDVTLEQARDFLDSKQGRWMAEVLKDSLSEYEPVELTVEKIVSGSRRF